MRLLIVDDDYQIREGMRHGIDWEKIGVSEIDTCSNGLEAMEIFREKQPEMIVADIQMPGMGGLEMMRQIREINTKTKVIFISAYSEFEYCRQALLMGASDYILKPVQMKKFMEIMKKNIYELQKREDERLNYYRAMVEQITRELYIVPKMEIEGDNLCNLLKDSFEFMGGSSFITIVVKKDNGPGTKKGLTYRQISKMIPIEEKEIIWLFGDDCLIGIAEGNSSSLMSVYRQNELAQAIRWWNQNYSGKNGSISVGISESHGKREFKKGYKLAKEALEQRFYEGGSSVLLCPFSPFKTEISSEIKEYMQMGKQNERQSDRESQFYYFYKMEVLFKREHIDKREFKRTLIEKYKEICEESGVIHTLDTLKEDLEECLFARDCVEILKKDFEIYMEANSTILKHSREEYSQTVRLALKYIDQQYCGQINVEQVAGIVGKSANYFSSLFKKETGFSFTEYITALRMEQAKWLLIHTNKQIREVCAEVGYTDYIYFSQVFRQRFGCSASMMRKGLIQN